MSRAFEIEAIRMASYAQNNMLSRIKDFEQIYRSWSVQAPVKYQAGWKRLAEYAAHLKVGGKVDAFKF